MSNRVVFLFDVDNTLLDNDAVTADLREHLEREVGHERQERYWSIFEDLRAEVGYADYLGALQRYRAHYPRDLHVLTVSHFLLTYPFQDRLFPSVLDVVQGVKQYGPPVILSDGDVVFQPHKIRQARLYDAFAGAVLIYVHKELELEDVARRYPADQYVLIDDKLRILSAIKEVWGEHVTTVFVRQGHYAHDEKAISSYRPADHTIERIADLLTVVR
jgi:FMN phosphatase YigB (HAD superfamily)